MLINSREVNKLLNWHIENSAYFDSNLLIDTMKEVIESDDNPSSDEDIQEAKRLHEFIRILSNKYIDIIRTPSPFSTKIIFEMIGKMLNAFGTEVIEQCLLIKKINEVPAIAERAIKIRPVMVKHRPQNKINYYYEQCINCYINGLSEAASILARSVLEYALREKVKSRNVINISDSPREDSIVRIIEICKINNIISSDIAEKAHKVRSKGNIASHNRALSEHEVEYQLNLLGEVLESLY